jgi:hypothetical protein
MASPHIPEAMPATARPANRQRKRYGLTMVRPVVDPQDLLHQARVPVLADDRENMAARIEEMLLLWEAGLLPVTRIRTVPNGCKSMPSFVLLTPWPPLRQSRAKAMKNATNVSETDLSWNGRHVGVARVALGLSATEAA